MPEDSSILKIHPSNGISPEPKDVSVSLEELERLIREWVNKILVTIDPPSGLWKRIQHQAKKQGTTKNDYE